MTDLLIYPKYRIRNLKNTISKLKEASKRSIQGSNRHKKLVAKLEKRQARLTNLYQDYNCKMLKSVKS